MEPLISKTPLPRPLEQEQWTTRWRDGKMFVELSDGSGALLSDSFHDFEDANKVRDAHNTRLRALQEELVAWREESQHQRASAQTSRERVTLLLAACKAKDEALMEASSHLGELISDGNRGTPERWKYIEDVRKAMCLQPDSSVKP